MAFQAPNNVTAEILGEDGALKFQGSYFSQQNKELQAGSL
ncbi:hypothetical protein CFBP1573P_02394 [Pseudomonas syringae pv. persicae]|uniref:Uncharacterized protein n=1 Tax=Pseudomonas syringae pv. persicae TaxID=237306 RepID=A0AB38ED73_9PSED|nr:hypothetical protein NCPPB2254_02220 [Pseudomonas syringae pv. persicae]SOQ09236.1 hypothetical protein CFBP1573P_02394 [Pseudomonas syringae pv. persicae]